MFLKEFTDEELMSKVAKGNLDPLKILFERHQMHVYNFLYKMSRDKMLSEDITQEVFMKLMKYRASYNNGNFISWLFTIARNCMKTHFRQRKESQEIADEYKLEADEEKINEYSHLHLALERLDPADRELIILNRLQEIKYAELAIIVDSTPGAVKTKVCRALKKLKTIYFDTI